MISHHQIILYLDDFLVTASSEGLAQQIITEGLITCQFVQRVHGAVSLARARFRQIQWEFLVSCRGEEDYDTYMFLSVEALEELRFW